MDIVIKGSLLLLAIVTLLFVLLGPILFQKPTFSVNAQQIQHFSNEDGELRDKPCNSLESCFTIA